MKNFESMNREERITTKRAMEANRETVLQVYKETRYGTVPETVDAIIDRLGMSSAIETIAELVNCVGLWDERIYPKTRKWAESVENAAGHEELRSAGFYAPSAIHPCHIDQLGEEMMKRCEKAL